MFCFCAHSRRLARALAARYDAALAPAGITAAQFETLSVLAACGPCGAGALAGHLVLDKTTLSRNMKALLETRLVESRTVEGDGRAVRYALSAQGRRTLGNALPLWQSAHDATAVALGRQALPVERALQRMVQAIH